MSASWDDADHWDDDQAGVVSTSRTSSRSGPTAPAANPRDEGAGSSPASRSITFFVAGTPVTQGSKKAFVVKGRAVIVDDADRELKSWREAVASEARRQSAFIDGPVAITCVFKLRKPASRPRRDVVPQGRRNDIDKLLRAVMDALTGVLFTDDGDVVNASVGKRWASPDGPAGVYVHLSSFAP